MDNIGVINETCKLLGIDRLTPDNTNLDDEAVWKSIRGDTTLIFQWESRSAQDYLKRFMSDETLAKVRSKAKNFSYLKWFSFGNGLLRPACASYRDGVADGEFYDNGFPELNEFLAPEAGRVCMQETIMMFLVKFCGYSQAESDNVRRAIAKKRGTETLLPEIEQRFIDYAPLHYNITKEKCAEVIKPFLQIILDASAYSFSWNHSDAYSAIGYISGYLRYYHPLEFLTAAFNTFSDNEEKTAAIAAYARKVGIDVLNIKFRYSSAKYSADAEHNAIYKGMGAIKFLNNDVAEALYELGKQHFDSFLELIAVFPGNSKQLDILIKLNYFEEFGSIGYLLNVVSLYETYGGRKVLNRAQLSVPDQVLAVIEKYATTTPKQYRITDSTALLCELLKLVKSRDISVGQRLQWEKEFIGYPITVDTKQCGTYVVLDIDTKYSPKITLYELWSGSSTVVKLGKREYQSKPLKFGDQVRVTIEKRAKSKKVGDEWVKDPNVTELWIKYYTII